MMVLTDIWSLMTGAPACMTNPRSTQIRGWEIKSLVQVMPMQVSC